MVRAVALLLVMISGCTDGTPAPAPDAGSGDPGAPAVCRTESFGNACVEEPDPAVTLCNDDRGWCIAGTCLLMCSDSCSCRATYSDRGACYCAP